MSQVTCKERSHLWVHAYAAGGAAFAARPIPLGTSLGLTAAEAYMVYWIGRVYGDQLSAGDIMMVVGGLEIASIGLKTFAMEALNFVPVIGWAIKPVIAAGAIEGIGAATIAHFEARYPGRLYAADSEVEASATRKK